MMSPRALEVLSVISAASVLLVHNAIMQNSVIWHDAKLVQSSSYPYYLYKYLGVILIISSHLFFLFSKQLFSKTFTDRRSICISFVLSQLHGCIRFQSCDIRSRSIKLLLAKCYWHHSQPLTQRTTPCMLFPTGYSVYFSSIRCLGANYHARSRHFDTNNRLFLTVLYCRMMVRRVRKFIGIFETYKHIHNSENGDTSFLRNVGKFLPDYFGSHPGE